jgi:1-acyl-sn-glycerol-3-phosphate acyltransferase
MYLLSVLRVAKSAVFALVYLIYLVLGMGFVQRFILVPLAWVFPVLTRRLLVTWGQFQARTHLKIVQAMAGVRITVNGRIGPENRLVIMNHQSVLDVPLGISLIPGQTIIPARKRYQYGIPGISVYLRLAQFPLISQKRKDLRADLAELQHAADRLLRGEATILIFPEGHRTKDGTILPFMMRGLRVILARAPVPVYCIVGDGMWESRTLADTITRVAGTHVKVRIIGPFHPPSEDAEIPAFLDSIRQRMIDTLEAIRADGQSQLLRDAV